MTEAMRWVLAAVTGAAIGLSGVRDRHGQRRSDPAACARPVTTSTSDELADMVMDVIQHGGPAAPTTTVVPAPPTDRVSGR